MRQTHALCRHRPNKAPRTANIHAESTLSTAATDHREASSAGAGISAPKLSFLTASSPPLWWHRWHRHPTARCGGRRRRGRQGEGHRPLQLSQASKQSKHRPARLVEERGRSPTSLAVRSVRPSTGAPFLLCDHTRARTDAPLRKSLGPLCRRDSATKAAAPGATAAPTPPAAQQRRKHRGRRASVSKSVPPGGPHRAAVLGTALHESLGHRAVDAAVMMTLRRVASRTGRPTVQYAQYPQRQQSPTTEAIQVAALGASSE
jgi:hypothetical protein